uniref:Uncharacterized protein n=1 Tax=Anguilla anguilla TaxID=7936 RepID=A0A0E9VZK5_ANGAN
MGPPLPISADTRRPPRSALTFRCLPASHSPDDD